jgi:hypothetical protein
MSNIADDPQFQAAEKALREVGENDPNFKIVAENMLAHMVRTPAYYTALGHFIFTFARVETILHRALWFCAGVRSPVAQAVFSGFKIEGCLQLIRRTAEAKNWTKDKREKLEEITNRLGPINRLRNDLLHYGVDLDMKNDDSWTFTNAQFVHVPERIRTETIILHHQSLMTQRVI